MNSNEDLNQRIERARKEGEMLKKRERDLNQAKADKIMSDIEDRLKGDYDILNFNKIKNLFTTAEGALIIRDSDGTEYTLTIARSTERAPHFKKIDSKHIEEYINNGGKL